MSHDFDLELGLSDDLDTFKKGAGKDVPNDPPSNAHPDDVEFARAQVRKAINIGVKTLENAEGLASASDDVRAFKVVSSLIDSVSAAADKLVRLRENKQNGNSTPALPAPGTPGALPAPTQTIAFIGSAADLLKEMDVATKAKTVDATRSS